MKASWFSIVLACLPAATFAQDTTPQSNSQADQRPSLASACAPDIRSLCSGIEPGGGRVAQCLKANAAKVSAPCRDAAKQMRGMRKFTGK